MYQLLKQSLTQDQAILQIKLDQQNHLVHLRIRLESNLIPKIKLKVINLLLILKINVTVSLVKETIDQIVQYELKKKPNKNNFKDPSNIKNLGHLVL